MHPRWWGGLNELPNLPDEGDVCWAKLSSPNTVILVGSLYLRNKTGLLPTSDLDFESQMSAIRSRVKEYQSKGAHDIVFLLGDVNCDHRRRGHAYTDLDGTSHTCQDDRRRCKALDGLTHQSDLIRADLLPHLKHVSTRTYSTWHIDMIAVSLLCQALEAAIRAKMSK